MRWKERQKDLTRRETRQRDRGEVRAAELCNCGVRTQQRGVVVTTLSRDVRHGK